MTGPEQAPAGWYPEWDSGSQRYWDGSTWTEYRWPAEATHPVAASPLQPEALSGPEIVQPPPGFGLVPGSYEVRPLREDPGFVHFLRYLLIGNVMALTIYLLIGIVWLAIALSQTGRRKRDLLMVIVPIWGWVVLVQTIWRYTAKNVYWSVRADRPSKSLFASA